MALVSLVMWELIQPLDDDSFFARFLIERGEGVHHLAVATPSFEEALSIPPRQGQVLVVSGTFSGNRIAFLPTDRDLGVNLEVFDGVPDGDGKRDATYSHQIQVFPNEWIYS